MTHTDNPTVSFIDAITALEARADGRDVTLGALVDGLDERAFGLLILILAIPCLVPGLPGAQLIAVPIFLLAMQLAVGRTEVWLPRRVLAATVKHGWLKATAGFARKRLRWTERLSRPRLALLATGLGERLVALAVAVAAITIMLPITNTIPSLAITVAAVGLLQRDGLFALAGTALAVAWVTALAVLSVGLMMGAGFAVEFVAEHAPWLAGLLGRS